MTDKNSTSRQSGRQIGRRAVLCALSALPVQTALAAATSRATAVAGPDPIFAAIEAHRRADTEYKRLCDIDTGLGDQPHVTDGLAWAMLEVDIRTFGGVAALLSYFAQEATADDLYFPNIGDRDEPLAVAVARVAAAAVARIMVRESMPEEALPAIAPPPLEVPTPNGDNPLAIARIRAIAN